MERRVAAAPHLISSRNSLRSRRGRFRRDGGTSSVKGSDACGSTVLRHVAADANTS